MYFQPDLLIYLIFKHLAQVKKFLHGNRQHFTMQEAMEHSQLEIANSEEEKTPSDYLLRSAIVYWFGYDFLLST